MAAPILKWKRITNASGPCPRPRHGHRAVAIKDLMIIFGGGNEGIVDELHVYNTATNQWFVPAAKGDTPPGCAAYGFVCDGTRILMFGGMVEYGKYSNELFELNASKWEWKKLKPKPPKIGLPPCPRLGHSFTLAGNKVFLFGGLANESDDPKNNIPRYLNDIYTLELKPNSSALAWDIPVVAGEPPPPRESHSAVAYSDKDGHNLHLIIYGGMSGCRLGDLWLLDIATLTWIKPTVQGVPPLPRSLHSSTVIGNRMFVFGGWVPLVMDDVKTATHEKEWKCTNTLGCLNLDTMTWEPLAMETLEDALPRARAGHSAVAIHTRLFIWSGRDGYRKAWNNQVCFKDLWFLETEKPPAPSRVQLVRASTNTLEVCWGSVPTADAYLLQLMKYDMPPATVITPSAVPAQAVTTRPLTATAPTMPQRPAVVRAPGQPRAAMPAVPMPNIIGTHPVSIPGTVGAPSIVSTPTMNTIRLTMPQQPRQRSPAASTTVPVVSIHQQQQQPVSQQMPQVLKVVGTQPGSIPQIITLSSPRAGVATIPMGGITSQMSGITTLAAGTPKVVSAASPMAGFRVMTPTAASQPSTLRVTPVHGGVRSAVASQILQQSTAQGLRVGTPGGAAIIRALPTGQVQTVSAGGLTSAATKQIITVKAGQGVSQPQIVTLVKTTQGMQVAQPGKALPQGATILKLVTSQAGTTGTKPAQLIGTGQLGTSVAVGATTGQQLQTIPGGATIIKGLTGGMLGTAASRPGLQVAQSAAGKQTIVIASPRPTLTGTAPRILTAMPRAVAGTPGTQYIVVTTRPGGPASASSSPAVTVPAGAQRVIRMPPGAQLINTAGGKQVFTIVTTGSTLRMLNTASLSSSMLGTAVPAQTSVVQVAATTVASHHTEPTTDGMEFSIDAATLEQLRASGDASSLIDASAFGDAGTVDDQPPMQVDGLCDDDAVDWTDSLSSLVQLDGPMDSEEVGAATTGEDGGAEGLDENELVAGDGQEGDEVQQEMLEQFHDDPQQQHEGTEEEGAEIEGHGAEHDFVHGLEGAEGTVGIAEGFVGEDALAAAAAEGFGEHLDAAEGLVPVEDAHGEGLDTTDPAAAYIIQEHEGGGDHDKMVSEAVAASHLAASIDTAVATTTAAVSVSADAALLLEQQHQQQQQQLVSHDGGILMEGYLKDAAPTDYMKDELPADYMKEEPNVDTSAAISSFLKDENEEHSSAGLHMHDSGSDPLTTLASAAIFSAPPPASSVSGDMKQEIDLHQEGSPTKSSDLRSGSLAKKDQSQWCDVGIIKGTTCVVSYYHLTSDVGTQGNGEDIDVVNVSNHNALKRLELQPGTAYKFRVAAINSCGRGPFSEVTAFKTCLPGFPGAPSSIKISKSNEGTHLSWDPPQNTAGTILEYSVYLAVRNDQSTPQQRMPGAGPAQLAFVRVYCGPHPQCLVQNASLSQAHVDYTTKPAIIFRIAARNEKGYGPATQVRWLQDSATNTASPKSSSKRALGDTVSKVPVGSAVKKPRFDGTE